MEWCNRTILSPLTKGGNLPFRRLCVDFGAEITVSEMAYARQIVRGSRSELALLRKHESERCFGVQLATANPQQAVDAGRIAVERGAMFVDLNCGCPIHDVVRRGMGATLLRRPKALARVVEALARELPVPVTVKLRSGWKEDEVNAREVARLCEEAGAAAITLHARTREQRYSQQADWELIAAVVADRSIPIIGNGDILTWFEASMRREQSGCAAVMIARGALIKPWIFREIAEQKTWEPTAHERIAVYHRLAGYLKEHFRDDAIGRERAMRFLPWHLSFFWRYRPFPESGWAERARQYPLIQTRLEREPDLPALESVLRDPRQEVHQRLADALWESADDAEAAQRFLEVAVEFPTPATDGGSDIKTSCG
ncbi:MAG: tRNA-dihydrouridine synthase family protein [Planctomycetota bacterium]|jgi:tRNA-dihydrouridine synthase 3